MYLSLVVCSFMILIRVASTNHKIYDCKCWHARKACTGCHFGPWPVAFYQSHNPSCPVWEETTNTNVSYTSVYTSVYVYVYMYMYLYMCIYICVYWYSCSYFYWERDINIFNTIHTHIDVQYFCSLVRSWPPWVDLAMRFLFLRWPCRSLKIWLKPGPCDSWKWVFIVVERGNRHGMARLGFQPSPNRSFIIGLPKLNGKEMGNTSRSKKDNHFSAFFCVCSSPESWVCLFVGGIPWMQTKWTQGIWTWLCMCHV